ncbi:hypothetical protein PMAYCL1PPCAC_21135, partial [Pristionchus mayeri]
MRLLLFLLLLLVHSASAFRAICYGEPGVNLPIRYFFAHLQDDDGRNRTDAVSDLNLHVDRKKDEGCRFHASLIDRGDGSYIGRIRILGSCLSLSISLMTKEKDELCKLEMSNVDGSLLLQEECLCPDSIPSSAKWIEHATCDNEPQLEEDLARFPKISFSSVLSEAVKLFGQPQHSRSYSTCHYAIKSNKIYRKCYGEYVGFAAFADDVLLSITRKMVLPDTQFIMNLGDYPLSHGSRGVKLPIISWCGSTETMDIVVPTYALTNTLLRGELFYPL